MAARSTVVTSLPPGTVCCLLCRGMVTYRNQDNTRFVNHMQYEHGAYFDMEFLLAACLMDDEERKAVRNVMELKYKSQMDKKEVTPVLSSADSTRQDSDKPADKPLVPQEEPPVLRQEVPLTRQEVSLTSKNDPVTRQKPCPEPAEPQVTVKKEVPEEVRVLPEQWDIPGKEENRPSFACQMCDKTFLLKKQLTTHQKKMNHFQTSETSSSPTEFNCKLCKYEATNIKALRNHVSKKHPRKSSPTPVSQMLPSPTPHQAQPIIKPASPTLIPNPSPAPSLSSPPGPSYQPPGPQPTILMSTMAKSWAKKKATKDVKQEPVETDKSSASLQEMSECETEIPSEGSCVDSSAEDDTADPDIPDDVSMEEASDTSSTVEDTTFVSIDSTENSINSIDTSITDPPAVYDVDISKSKYFKANPQTVGQMLEGKGEDQFSVVDDKMPEGWRVKEIVHEFKSGRKERKRNYLTPDQKVLKTGLAVLEYMRLSGDRKSVV